MTSKKEIYQLARLCAMKGIETVVFSPGSRNAPLVIAFNAMPKMQCLCIVDERAAAFFALGIAQATQKTVVIVCTSGTATLNYAPAIAEAFYQEIPLLVLTADRPIEWIDQADMQSIRQNNVYANYIKKSFQLPQQTHAPNDLWYAERIVAEAINHTQFPAPGPVHINIPFTEPLYDLVEFDNLPLPKNIKTTAVKAQLPPDFETELKEIWQKSSKILIIVGLHYPNAQLLELLEKLATQNRALVITESCSNMPSPHFFPAVDRLIDTLSLEEELNFQPHLVITIGGMIVSKKIKTYLRKHPANYHWSCSTDYKHQDTFQQLSHLIPLNINELLTNVCIDDDSSLKKQSEAYCKQFWAIENQRIEQQKYYLQQLAFCDFIAVQTIIDKQPADSVFQWGNSTPVRYANLFNIPLKNIENYANRGVGGIDGTVSTAAGFAFATPQKMVTHITGDLAFFYDSNALWNEHLPNNLRIILINNSGGNIFRIIPGPAQSQYLEQFFEHKHQQTAHKLCEAFGVAYQAVDNKMDLENALNSFFEPSQTAQLLEIKTNGEYSAKALQDFFPALRK